MIIVSKSKIADKVTGQLRPCKYSDVPTDSNRWVFDLNYLPIPYDLMHLKFSNGDRIKSGWWTGIKWKGLRKKKKETVIAWKMNQEHD